MSFSLWPSIWSRSLSVSLPHCVFTSPLIWCHVPLNVSLFIWPPPSFVREFSAVQARTFQVSIVQPVGHGFARPRGMNHPDATQMHEPTTKEEKRSRDAALDDTL